MKLADLKNISPAWWGAIAGAIAAGASLLPDSRLLGGLGAGAAMLYFAHKQSMPCCAACADKTAAPRPEPASDEAPMFDGLGGLDAAPVVYRATTPTTAIASSAGCTSCGGLDAIATAPTIAPTRLRATELAAGGLLS